MSSKKQEVLKIKDISKELFLSESFLRRIIFDLEKTQIIKSVKGRNGGVYFDADLSKTSLYDILEAVNEDLSLTSCTGGDICKNEDFCNTTKALKGLQKGITSLLKLYTLDKIIK